MKTDFAQPLVLEQPGEILGDIIWLDAIAQLVHIQIAEIFHVVGASAYLLVSLLLRFETLQQAFDLRHQGQGTVAGLVLYPVLLYHDHFAVQRRFYDRVPDGDGELLRKSIASHFSPTISLLRRP